MITRQQLEEREEQTLAAYAMRNSATRGRRYPETEEHFATEALETYIDLSPERNGS